MARAMGLRMVSVWLVCAGCVPLNEISGAPCPCPKEAGYICCNEQCVKASACPADGDGSTNGDTECRFDTECDGDAGEVCRSWQDDNGIMRGPGLCTSKCGADSDCSKDASCELTLHDGRPHGDTHVTLACVDTTAEPGCNAAGCSECAQAPFGTTYCADEDTVETCVTATDPVCGLYCKTIVIAECKDATCIKESETSHAVCSDVFQGEPFDEDLCNEYSCADCEPPGQATACNADTVHACLRFPIEPIERAPCDALCYPWDFENCE